MLEIDHIISLSKGDLTNAKNFYAEDVIKKRNKII